MALIKCMECGHVISDKASACPHCGCPLDKDTKKACEECGYQISENDIECPHCGCPVQLERNVQVAPEQKHHQSNFGKIILGVVLCVAVLFFIPGIMSIITKGGTTHLSDLTFEVDKSTGRTYALKNGEAFDGTAYSDDEDLFSIHVSDGRVDHLEICHKNGKTAVKADMDFGKESIAFYDEEGNEMSAQAFYIAYPAIVAETMNVQKQMNGLY